MFTFQLPEIGEGVVEGEIVKWLVHEGDVISADQPVAEIMTDKATIEVTTPKSGKVMTRHGSEGDIVAVHSPLLEIDDGAAGAAAPAPAPAPRAAPAPADAPTAPPPGTSSRPRKAAASSAGATAQLLTGASLRTWTSKP